MQLPISDRIRLSSPVHLIRWNPDSSNSKVQVVCSDQTFEADMVLVTCSLGVLKDKADKLFIPHLPEKKKKAIEVRKVNSSKYPENTYRILFLFSGLRVWYCRQNLFGVSKTLVE